MCSPYIHVIRYAESVTYQKMMDAPLFLPKGDRGQVHVTTPSACPRWATTVC